MRRPGITEPVPLLSSCAAIRKIEREIPKLSRRLTKPLDAIEQPFLFAANEVPGLFLDTGIGDSLNDLARSGIGDMVRGRAIDQCDKAVSRRIGPVIDFEHLHLVQRQREQDRCEPACPTNRNYWALCWVLFRTPVPKSKKANPEIGLTA